MTGSGKGLAAVTVVIDNYTNSSILKSGGSVPLGTQLILVCRVVGLPYGTPLSYTWTCPNGPCKVEGYYGRKVYNEHILAVNTTSTSDGGTYTCYVTVAGQRKVRGGFTLKVTGGLVVHSYGRLIPHEFPITDLQQISGPDGIGRINCTVSFGRARFLRLWPEVNVKQTGATTTLVVNPNYKLVNSEWYCEGQQFYLYISGNRPYDAPFLTWALVINSFLHINLLPRSEQASHVAGYEVIRFGVPMTGEYVNRESDQRVVIIGPVVLGAQYKIIAWAIGNGSRSENPAVRNTTTREAAPSTARSLTITRVLQDGIELNWLPPTEPNGEVHYVVEYKREDSGSWTSVNTTSDSTHYNLTGLHCGTISCRVVAMNSAGRAPTMPTISYVQSTCSTGTPTSSSTTTPTSSSTTTPTSSSTTTPTSSSTATPTSSSTATPTAITADDTAHITGMIIYCVVGVSVLVAAMALTVGATLGVICWKRVQKRKGEPPQRKGGPPQRQREPPQRHRGPPQRRGEPPQRQGEPPQRRGEPPQRWGEPPQSRGEPPQRRGEPPHKQRKSQRLNVTIPMSRAADYEKEYTEGYTYEYVNDESYTDERVTVYQYQGLVARTQDYPSVYNQLSGETYQELDPRGREREPYYQRPRANHGREKQGGRN